MADIDDKVIVYATVSHNGEAHGLTITGLFWDRDHAVNQCRARQSDRGHDNGGVRPVDVTEFLKSMPEAKRRLCQTFTEATAVDPTKAETDAGKIVNDVRKMFGDTPFVTDLSDKVYKLLSASAALRREVERVKAEAASLKLNLRTSILPFLEPKV